MFLPVGDHDVRRWLLLLLLHLGGGRGRYLEQILRIADLYLSAILLLLYLLLDRGVMVPMHVHVLELMVMVNVHVVGHGQRVSHHVAGLLEREHRLVLVVVRRRPGLLMVFVEYHRLVERTVVHIAAERPSVPVREIDRQAREGENAGRGHGPVVLISAQRAAGDYDVVVVVAVVVVVIIIIIIRLLIGPG